MSSVFDILKLQHIINAAGTLTTLSGSRVDADVAQGMAEIAQSSVDIAELQGRASELIAEFTGAEAGMVTAGASSALLLGTAACLTGLDPYLMDKLPDTTGMRNEFLIARAQRNSYDHAVRAAGVRLIEVGVADRLVGVGVRDTEIWEFERAIHANTAGILYVARPHAHPLLTEVTRIARQAKLPVLVDAAAELPPLGNLRRFIDAGADLVAFSGGKALGGPSASGILCGSRALIGAALLQQLDLDYDAAVWQPPRQLFEAVPLQGLPRNGIGRSCKVGKEQIVGLLLALSKFAAVDDQARRESWSMIARNLLAVLDTLPVLRARIVDDPDGRGVPLVEVSAGPAGNFDAAMVALKLHAMRPSVRVDTACANAGVLRLVPTCLTLADVAIIVEAFAVAVG